MATLEQQLDTAIPSLKTYNALSTPTAAQQTAQIKLLTQLVAMLIFLHENRPDQTP
jgi:hypothetical protein